MSQKLRHASEPPADWDPAAAAERPPLGGSEDPSATTLLWSPSPGALHGRPGYAIGRRIGAGGFAEVFEAELRRPPLPPQRVALKRLLPGLRGDPGGKRQLRREAQIAARLAHENIVKVFELLELDDELVIVMELVDGLAGSQLLHLLAQRGHALRLPAIAYLLQGLFSALDYLTTGAPRLTDSGELALGASRPLCHADISLENLMVTATGGIKLIDFGLAGQDRSLPRPSSAGEDESLTALHQMAGKRTYAPPTTAALLPSAPTVKSDLYAAGVCAWELFTGLRFPLLPEGAAARELGSLVAFAGDGLPEAGWRLLKLCLLSPESTFGTAEQGLALSRQLSSEPFSPQAMGALVQSLTGLPCVDDDLVATATTPTAFPDRLLQRLRGAFCAHRVLAQRPGSNPDGTSDPGGELRFHLSPPAAVAPSCIIAIDPGPGRVYDPRAQALLCNLLGQNARSFAKPAKSQLK